MEAATWMMVVDAEGVEMRRLHDGKPVEVYPKMDHARGAIYAAAISQGFQPPRDLRACDRPAG